MTIFDPTNQFWTPWDDELQKIPQPPADESNICSCGLTMFWYEHQVDWFEYAYDWYCPECGF